ncbi:ankyrin repeat-containing domain protein [Fusarium solani]|uniref:protein S-acyltransferase n=1 Tax=Fusarium solani TaxID=169388 RepID=A0A9P9GKP3_FUSSL|nr:ankyrin repeat-containing domain protein [Fusarium solani]KAH7239769.1 ankyrin repeat-containing domain protein [Fusarium solani]
MTLAEVMRLMEDEHSKAQYVRKLKNWGMEKNSTNQKWKVAAQQVQKRKLEGKETEILINGRLIPWKKLRKETARYTGSQSDMIEGSDIPTDLSTGVIARTPPGEVPTGIQTIHIPWFQFQAFVESSIECLTVDASPLFMNLPSTYNPTEWEHSMGFSSDLGTEPLPSISNNELDLLLGWDPSSANDEQAQASSLLDPSCRGARGLLGECLGESIDPDNPDYSSRISSSLEEITIDRHDGDLVHHVKRLSTASGQEAVFQLLRYTVYLSSNNLLSDTKTDKLLRWVINSGHLWTLESLLGSTLPTTKIFASNLLVSAARLGEVNLVKALLAKGFDPNTLAGTPEKKTPLEVAADQGSVSLVKVLLDAKASPNVHHQNSHPASKTALHSTISGRHKNSVIARMLIDGGADVNAVVRDWDRPTTMLNLAAHYGDPDLVQKLLDAGARVNEMSVGEGTALQIAVSRGNIDITEILIAAGADVDCPIGKAYQYVCKLSAEKGWPDVIETPIQRAANEDNMEMVQVLLEAGADIDGFPDREVFPRLMSSGKPSEEEDEEEEEPDWDHLDLTCRPRPALMSAVARENIVLVRMLLNLGADVNARGCEGTALQLASAQGNLKLVQLLLKGGADVNSAVQNHKRGRTALQAAAGSGDEDLVECLLKAGAQVNALPSSCEGRTAVQAAVESKNIDLVKLLVNAGADINAAPAPTDGCTCLQAAAASKNVEMVELLLQLGADVDSPASSESGGRT